MKRPVGALLTALLVCAGLLSAPAQASNDPTTIQNFDADYTVSKAGNLNVIETLTVNFPVARHGIFRTFASPDIEPTPPLPDRNSVKVTRDGRAEPMAIVTTAGGYEVKIGDPTRTLTGTHVYRISYSDTNVVNPGDDQGNKFSEFFWEPIGKDWTVRILASHITFHLPEAARFAGSCGIGDGGTGECGGAGTKTATFKTGLLKPGTPVYMRVDYGDAGPDSPRTVFEGGGFIVLGSLAGLADFFDSLFD